MEYTRVQHLEAVQEREPTYLAIGSFDGVHLGHQAVLRRMVAAARENGARPAVLTFFPHPKRVLKGVEGPYYISRLEDRVKLLAKLGIELIITQPFTDKVRRTRAADFVEQLLRHLDMRQLWGGDFAFGYQREGDVPFLRRLGKKKGFSVQLVEAMVEVAGDWVSSSRIRRCLREGKIREANACLGRPYQVSGEVVMGDQRGRTIGFPTANLDVWEEQILPANGVYAGYAWAGDRRYAAATNVGLRPTVGGRTVTVESHLLAFDENIYGEELRVEFMQRIRPERKFDGLPALKAQIGQDVTAVRQALSREPERKSNEREKLNHDDTKEN